MPPLARLLRLQIQFYDDDRGPHAPPPQVYRLEELFNRMAKQMGEQENFARRLYAKAESAGRQNKLGSGGALAGGHNLANYADGAAALGRRRKRQPRQCSACLCFLWVRISVRLSFPPFCFQAPIACSSPDAVHFQLTAT